MSAMPKPSLVQFELDALVATRKQAVDDIRQKLARAEVLLQEAQHAADSARWGVASGSEDSSPCCPAAVFGWHESGCPTRSGDPSLAGVVIDTEKLGVPTDIDGNEHPEWIAPRFGGSGV